MQNKDLSKFLNELGLKDDYNIEEDLGDGFVKLKISEAERRQALQDICCVEDILIELLRNARDAGSNKIFISTKKVNNRYRIINCIDNGIGIPPRFHELIFASRVTSKLEDGKKDSFGFHGRGMALFSIRLNVDEVKIIFSDHNIGTSFYIKTDLEKIPEKKDQSSYPSIEKIDSDYIISGGVNNIIKTILDFQIENPDIDFYYGTQTQILASMRSLAKKPLSGSSRLLEKPKDLHGYLKKSGNSLLDIAGLASDYSQLKEISSEVFGMDISGRNIQRIIYNDIEPIVPLKEQLSVLASSFKESGSEVSDDGKKTRKNKKSDLSLKDEKDISKLFDTKEIDYIKDNIKNVINKIGKKYFITTDNDIECYKKENTLRFIVELKQKD